MLRIDSLVAFFIFFVGFSFYIFWQWSFTQLFENGPEFFFCSFPKETNGATPAGGVINHLCHQVFLITEIKLVAYPDLPGRVNDYIPKAVWPVQFTQQKHFDLGTCFFLTA